MSVVFQVSKSVDELVIPLANAVDPCECFSILMPVVAREGLPVLLIALKLLTRVGLSGLSVCTSVCLSVCLSVCMSVCLSVCMYVCLYVCLSLCLCLSLSVCLYVCMSVCLYVSLCLCLSTSIVSCLVC